MTLVTSTVHKVQGGATSLQATSLCWELTGLCGSRLSARRSCQVDGVVPRALYKCCVHLICASMICYFTSKHRLLFDANGGETGLPKQMCIFAA